MTVLAAITLASWVLLGGALLGSGGNTKGFHVLIPPVLSIVLAVAVLIP